MKEQEILTVAMEKLTHLTGAVIVPVATKIRAKKTEIDALVEITFQNIKRVFAIEIKNEVRISNLQDLLKIKHQTDRDFLVICQYIPMPLKRELKLNEINYLEAAGNCFIQTAGIFLYINDQQVTEVRLPTEGKLWKAAGLKFLFVILYYPELLDEPYRNIANQAQIALGNIGGYLGELRNEGFLREGHKKENKVYYLDNRDRLIQKWAEAYITNLRPKQMLGNFRFADKDQMRHWEDLQGDFKWGGENAGAILTQYLTPERFTIYTTEAKNKLMQKLKLVPDPNGPVELLLQFWQDKEKEIKMQVKTVPPLLAYAELITSFDSRNRETAERIKTQYLD